MKKLISVLLVAMLIITLFPSLAKAASKPSDWAVDEINLAKEAGLITDRVAKDYAALITREEFCELVIKLYEKLTNTAVVMIQIIIQIAVSSVNGNIPNKLG